MAVAVVSDGPKLFQGVARGDFAFKLLKQMGWEEGMGLGKEKQGIKTHIRVKKNVEQSGVGLAEARKEATDWTVNTSVYDRILANLKVKSAGERVVDAVESESDSEAEKERPKKRTRKEDDEQPKKLARHVGRYKKREASKAVAGYATHHLQEILGGQPSSPKVDLPAADPVATNVTLVQEQTEDVVVVKKKKKSNKSKCASFRAEEQTLSFTTRTATETVEAATSSGRLTSTTAVTVTTTGVGAGDGLAAESLAANPGWWGHKCGFVKGGQLGEKQKKKENGEDAKRGFLEQDQEDLYNLVQDKKTSGKQGLGIGSQPKKVAGARWKGSKVNFDESGSEDHDEAAEPAPANGTAPCVSSYNDVLEQVRGARDEDLVGNGNILSIKDKTGRADAKDRELRNGGVIAGANEGGVVAGVKWKKLLTKELEEVALKGIKLSKLRKRLVAAALAKPSAVGLGKAEAKTIAEEKIRTSAKCVVDGDRVFPATGVALPLRHKA